MPTREKTPAMMKSDEAIMTEVYPGYYDRFVCIADRCEDTCCAGWEIDIDDASYDAYMRVGGDLGARLNACIKTYGEMNGDDSGYEEVYEQHGFVLTEDMRCPFLDEHNLCDLYKELGEEALCEVCTNTPRNYLEYRQKDTGMVREISVSASCPEAARLIYGSAEPMTFVKKEVPDEPETEISDEDAEDEARLGAFLRNVRDEAISILQDRDKTLDERIRLFLLHADLVQDAINDWESGESRLPETVSLDASRLGEDHTEKDHDADIYRHFLIRMGTYSGLAGIGQAWAERMELLAENFVGDPVDHEDNYEEGMENPVYKGYKSIYLKTSDILNRWLTNNGLLYLYEHLLVYYAFLLLNRSIDDYDYLGKAKLVVLSYLMNRDMDAAIMLKKNSFEKKDREENARIYAREVEHAEENLADLFEEILFERAYDTKALITLFA